MEKLLTIWALMNAKIAEQNFMDKKIELFQLGILKVTEHGEEWDYDNPHLKVLVEDLDDDEATSLRSFLLNIYAYEKLNKPIPISFIGKILHTQTLCEDMHSGYFSVNYPEKEGEHFEVRLSENGRNFLSQIWLGIKGYSKPGIELQPVH